MTNGADAVLMTHALNVCVSSTVQFTPSLLPRIVHCVGVRVGKLSTDHGLMLYDTNASAVGNSICIHCGKALESFSQPLNAGLKALNAAAPGLYTVEADVTYPAGTLSAVIAGIAVCELVVVRSNDDFTRREFFAE